MGIDIHKIPLGVANCYVIKEEGAIMIDSGTPKKGKRFVKSLKKLSINPKDIKLIIILLMSFFISPTASHALASAAMRNDRLWESNEKPDSKQVKSSNP